MNTIILLALVFYSLILRITYEDILLSQSRVHLTLLATSAFEKNSFLYIPGSFKAAQTK